MKRILLSILIILLVNIITAQNFAPLGSKWNYTYSNFSVFGYVELESVSDTMVNGLNCKKLIKTKEVFDYMYDEYHTMNLGFEIISSDEDKVYIFRNGQFYTLYDFSADINDTWEIPMTYDAFFEDCDTLGTIQVIAKGDTIIEDQNLRYIVVEPLENSSWALEGLIIENIGAVEYYLLPEQLCVIDFYEGGLFRCYSDDLIVLHQGPYPCTYITVGINDIENKMKLSSYPNPAQNYIVFESPNAELIKHIKIYNSTGRLIEELEFNQPSIFWICEHMSVGIYYYEAQIAHKVYRGKFLIN